MQPQVEQNENSSLINKNWTDNSTLNEIVKYEYQKSNKTEFENTHLDLLYNQGLKFLGDWKKVTKEEKKLFPIGLKHLLDEKAGIEQENVGVLKRKREEDFQRPQIQKYEKNIKNWSRNGTVLKDQSYFYVERTNLINEFYSKLNKPNEMVFFVYCGPRASGKSSFTKTLLPPKNGINILFEFYNFNSKHHC
jgi:hypothetical protein